MTLILLLLGDLASIVLNEHENENVRQSSASDYISVNIKQPQCIYTSVREGRVWPSDSCLMCIASRNAMEGQRRTDGPLGTAGSL